MWRLVLVCQAYHESIHGLYPVTPNVDRTTYKQAAQLNSDASHGSLKFQACHNDVNRRGVPFLADKLQYSNEDKFKRIDSPLLQALYREVKIPDGAAN
jgi:hypothetical protein